MAEIDDPLEAAWAEVRVPRTEADGPDAVPDFSSFARPQDLVIGSKNNPLAIIRPDGGVAIRPGYTPDQVAAEFWEVMGQRRLEMEERLLLFAHMEAVFVRLGQADLRAEDLRRRAAEETDETRARELTQLAELAVRRLEMVAHEAIELGRGMARRDIPAPPVPPVIPRVIQENENSTYSGAEGLGET